MSDGHDEPRREMPQEILDIILDLALDELAEDSDAFGRLGPAWTSVLCAWALVSKAACQMSRARGFRTVSLSEDFMSMDFIDLIESSLHNTSARSAPPTSRRHQASADWSGAAYLV
jgi:hypothetical protein